MMLMLLLLQRCLLSCMLVNVGFGLWKLLCGSVVGSSPNMGFGFMRIAVTSLFALLVIFYTHVVHAQTPSKQDFLRSVENYHYSSISMNKVADVGCSKYVVGFPVGFSLATVETELLANSPEAALNKISGFLADPKYAAAINDQLSWMGIYRTKKSAKEFQSMCADFGGKKLMEWQQYRKDFLKHAAYFK